MSETSLSNVTSATTSEHFNRAAAPSDAVLIGDSVTDIQAARAAGTAAIAYANKPGKDRALRSFDPDALITSMDEIAHAA